jgi:potassium/hydrogen antiporter
MDFGFQWLAFGALLILASVFAHLVSRRFGAPILLVFLVIGMLVGEDGPVGIHYDDARGAFLMGSIALAVILFDGGLRTPMSAIRSAWAPSLSLATVGVIVTAAVVALFLVLVFKLDWRGAMLIGSIVAATDAAAVFGLLSQHGIGLPDRMSATLEVESGANDPMGIFLTVVFVEMMRLNQPFFEGTVLLAFIREMGIGFVLGAVGGYGLAWLVNRIEMTGGLYPILVFAGAMLIFAGTQTIHGSGFLAVYVAGVVFGNRRVRALQLVVRFFDGLTWLGQIGLFVLLGLLVTPSQLPDAAPLAISVAVILIVLARPLAVMLSLSPFGFSIREQLFVSWVGLRGAVPIFLALLPYLADLDPARFYFKVAFVVVLVSLAVQGWTMPIVARLLDVALPPVPEPAPRLDVDLIHTLDRDLIAYEVKPHSRATDWPINDLRLPERVRIVSVLRGDQVLTPESLERLQANDVALVLTPPEHSLAVDRWFSRRFASTATELTASAGDFVLDGGQKMRELADSYGIAVDAKELDLTLAQAIQSRLGKNAGRGARARVGPIALVVLDKIGNEIRRVGLILDPPPEGWRGLLERLRRRGQKAD